MAIIGNTLIFLKTNNKIKYLFTCIAVLRSSVATIFTRPPRRPSLRQPVSQYTVSMIVSDVAGRTATETIIQSFCREDHGSEFCRSTFKPRHRPLDSPAK